mgnify:CR=1 FL=1
MFKYAPTKFTGKTKEDKATEVLTLSDNAKNAIETNVVPPQFNQRIINMFDDIVCYLVFYQIEDFAELYLDKYIRLNDSVNNWWSGKNFAEILQNAINLGQCFLPAIFSISKIQETPPIFKFLYNKNLYRIKSN